MPWPSVGYKIRCGKDTGTFELGNNDKTAVNTKRTGEIVSRAKPRGDTHGGRLGSKTGE